jgi:hypothetical protein
MERAATAAPVLAFDIGIKNLAFCSFDKGKKEILAWENVNLLLQDEGSAGAAAATAAANKCKKEGCKFNATWIAGGVSYCLKHIPATHRVLKDLSGATVKKMPALADLKVLFSSAALASKKVPKTKADCIAALAPTFAFPVESRSTKKATQTGLETIHDAIRKMITDRRDVFARIEGGTILLENQPVFKNPTMKSVQMILFTTLREFYYAHNLRVPDINFVHAGKKVKGVEKGDAGYAARKEGGEERATKWLEAGGAAALQWAALFRAAKKKSDLADALCMCLDFEK